MQANLDGADHPEPVVEKTFLRFAAATSRDEAIKLADAGDTDGAASVLCRVADQFAPYLDDAEMAQEREDLTQEAARLKEREFTPVGRKYMQAFSMSLREGKRAYMDKLRRPGGKK